jgi:glycosyltransferase involved in cell wall biosynthesis
MSGITGEIGVVMPRNMRFSPHGATSIDLYAQELTRASRHTARITVFAERADNPFPGVRVRFWEPGAAMAARVKLIAAAAPRIVVVHQHLPTAAAVARRLRSTPVVLVRHNFVKPPRGPLSGWWRHRQFRRLAGLAFVSECCASAFRSQWPDVQLPLFVTPNGIDTVTWRPAGEKRPRIVFTGRLAPEKGVLEAVRALNTVLRRHPDWDAVLMLATAPRTDGYDSSVRAAVAESNGRIRTLEDLSHSEVRSIVAEAEIALAPTQTFEPFGRVAIEALASGTALIATRRGGFIEVVGDAGVLIDPPSAEQIADALHSLIDDPARRARLGALGPARIAGRYDMASAAAAFDRIVDQLTASPSKPSANRDAEIAVAASAAAGQSKRSWSSWFL